MTQPGKALSRNTAAAAATAATNCTAAIGNRLSGAPLRGMQAPCMNRVRLTEGVRVVKSAAVGRVPVIWYRNNRGCSSREAVSNSVGESFCCVLGCCSSARYWSIHLAIRENRCRIFGQQLDNALHDIFLLQSE